MNKLFFIFLIALGCCIYAAFTIGKTTHDRALAVKEDRAIKRDIQKSIAMTTNRKRERAMVIAEMSSRAQIRRDMEAMNLHTPSKEEVALLKK